MNLDLDYSGRSVVVKCFKLKIQVGQECILFHGHFVTSAYSPPSAYTAMTVMMIMMKILLMDGIIPHLSLLSLDIRKIKKQTKP